MPLNNILGNPEDIKEILDRLGIAKGNGPVDSLEVSRYDCIKYKPSDFKLPTDGFHFVGTLGKCEWEIIAWQIIKKCKEAGKWVPLKAGELEEYVDHEMLECGYLEETEDGCYMLTEDALGRIYAKYANNSKT